jgi:hypothetical protein
MPLIVHHDVGEAKLLRRKIRGHSTSSLQTLPYRTRLTRLSLMLSEQAENDRPALQSTISLAELM